VTLADPFGFALTTIRDLPAVAALTTRVRPVEPMGRQVNAAGVETDAGDARGPGSYVRFIVLRRLGRIRVQRVPTQAVRLVAMCYGLTARDADQLAAAVSDGLHGMSHRISGGGVSVFSIFDDGGDGAVKDPDTGQYHADVVLAVGALTALVT
jgi:hypothetical protein